MKRTVNNLLNIARGQLGYCEKASNSNLDDFTTNAGSNNYTKYARDLAHYGYYQASKQGFEWCDMFVDWNFLVLCDYDPVEAQKMICQTGPYGAGCDWSANYYKYQNRFFKSNPKPGDQIFLWDYAHTGLVEEVTATTITTIEGNSSNMVRRRYYSINSSDIDGFGRPYYEEDDGSSSTTPVTPAPVTPPATSSDTSTGTYTVKPGDSWWGIAESEMGDGTKMNELAKFNGTTTSKIIHPGDVIKIPGKYNNGSNNTATESNTSSDEYFNYTIQSGDSWWGIAEKFLGNGSKMNDLAKFNGVTVKLVIHPGEVIKIPGKNTTTDETVKTYKVRPGDSWWGIAESEMGDGTKMNELAKFNGTTTSKIIHPGDVIKIPG